MFSSLVRGLSKGSRQTKSSLVNQSSRAIPHDYDSHAHDEDEDDYNDNDQDEMDDDLMDEDDADEEDPLLPLFSAAHLDSLPVYTLTHAIRVLVVKRCETTLSWEQLRSPQISQFLVKPIQIAIRSSHFNRATLYVLLVNCFQFKKEGQANPGIVGICNTRALIAELLAMRLLKEYSTRELIDALSYDFNPTSGMPQPSITFQDPRGSGPPRRAALSRTSTLEVSIRAEAKRFIAHPLVVQHLEAIWAGSIVFHSAADRLHRYPTKPRTNHDRHYGAMHSANPTLSSAARPTPPTSEPIRRSVTLYDPSNASLFKLSRLRVPRYRQVFSTLSYGVMLVLFLAVLSERSLKITGLEIVFWFWSAGFMLDELVGFSEQGFGLYIASVWNVFDIGILLLLLVYYLLRIASVLIPGPDKGVIAGMAYDVLASTAVLLFPRFFNMLDHYRYFSQLLIAFRLMAQDLAAVLILIAISCSGFFVAFTYSFGQDEFDGRGVAYALFQMIMGFTPAAWDVWSDFNPLGQVLLALFLLMCHFLVVTILISVLTNSFMAIVKNANEEHQFLFAVNVISMVKSDMLFSFIAPTNLAGWIIAPLRFCIPFPQYVMINRTLIKLTHFPVLFSIFAYERIRLLGYSHEPVDFVERRGRSLSRMPTFAMGQDPYGTHLRHPSAATFQDQALAEVFRRPFDDGSQKREPSTERRKSVVDQWMSGLSGAGTPRVGDAGSTAGTTAGRKPRRGPRSLNSEDIGSHVRPRSRSLVSNPAETSRDIRPELRQSEASDLIRFDADDDTHADADDDTHTDADDELATNDDLAEHSVFGDEDRDKENKMGALQKEGRVVTATIKFREPLASSAIGSHVQARVLSSSPSKFIESSPRQRSRMPTSHSRQASTNTIIFKPLSPGAASSSSSRRSSADKAVRRASRPTTAIKSAEWLSPPPRKSIYASPRVQGKARPIMPPRQGAANASVPNLTSFFAAQPAKNRPRRAPSLDTLALDLASDIGDNRYNDAFLPGSFQTQMQYGLEAMRRRSQADDQGAVSRMVLARMSTIEEGFRDILREVKDLKNSGSRGGSANEAAAGSPSRRVLGSRAGRATRLLARLGDDREIPSTTARVASGAAQEDTRSTSGRGDSQGAASTF